MTDNISTMPTMAKEVWITLRTTEKVKQVIEELAKEDGRPVGNYILRQLGQGNERIANALRESK